MARIPGITNNNFTVSLNAMSYETAHALDTAIQEFIEKHTLELEDDIIDQNGNHLTDLGITPVKKTRVCAECHRPLAAGHLPNCTISHLLRILDAMSNGEKRGRCDEHYISIAVQEFVA